MGKKKIGIIWTADARKQLLDIIIYLQSESPIGAEIVLDALESRINQLPENPLRYPADSLRKNKNRLFRTFTVFNYRVAYRITEKAIVIHRIRHTRRDPLEY